MPENDTNSLVTIYQNAVQHIQPGEFAESKRDSTSSEDAMDTSDEIDKLPNGISDITSTENLVSQFIAGIAGSQQEHLVKRFGQQKYVEDGEQVHCSCDGGRIGGHHNKQTTMLAPVQLSKAEQMIKDTEMSCTRILQVPGKDNSDFNARKQYLHPSIFDEDYLVIGAAIDSTMKERIGNGGVCGFCKVNPQR